jgi:hypothetical protein
MQALENNVEIKPEEYILWQIALDSVDKPNDSGNLGTYTQPENSEALGVFAEKVGLNPSDKEDRLALAYLWQVSTDGVSKNNPYGNALKGTPWYKPNGKKENSKLWMKER